jgi:hypothetical protein
MFWYDNRKIFVVFHEDRGQQVSVMEIILIIVKRVNSVAFKIPAIIWNIYLW